MIYGAQERYNYNYHIGRRHSLCAVIVGSSIWKFVWKVYVCAFCCVCRYLDELLSCCSHMIKVPNQLICRRICRPLWFHVLLLLHGHSIFWWNLNSCVLISLAATAMIITFVHLQISTFKPDWSCIVGRNTCTIWKGIHVCKTRYAELVIFNWFFLISLERWTWNSKDPVKSHLTRVTFACLLHVEFWYG